MTYEVILIKIAGKCFKMYWAIEILLYDITYGNYFKRDQLLLCAYFTKIIISLIIFNAWSFFSFVINMIVIVPLLYFFELLKGFLNDRHHSQ